MRLRTILPVLFIVSLAACDHEADDVCDLYPGTDPGSALVSAQIDGRQFAGHIAISTPAGTWNKTTGRLYFHGASFHQNWQETILIVASGVTGPGAYPIGPHAPPGTDWTSEAYYWCEASRQGFVRSTGGAGDSIWVTSVDTVMGVVAGTFSFSGIGEFDGLPHTISAGAFQIPVRIDGAATADTLLSAMIDGVPFVVSSASGTTTFAMDSGAPTVNLIARQVWQGSEKILHLTLWRFDGVGAYPLEGPTNEGHDGLAGFGTPMHAWWSDTGPSSDTAWVTAWDPLTGRIEGSFGFVGGGGGTDTVVVSGGSFNGIVTLP